MVILALDIDGVLLDSDRGGAGHWTNELHARFGISRTDFSDAFFIPSWDDVVNGRRPIESAVAAALATLGSTASAEDVLECWFRADCVMIPEALAFARRAVAAGIPVALVTNQEHRRAQFLTERFAAEFPTDAVLYSADLGVQKHLPEFFDLASQRLGLPPRQRSQVVFVDDTVENVRQAAASGWTAIHADQERAWIAMAERALGLG